ncbi:membrane protein, partial [Streptomyces sp. NRRL S-444]
FWETVERTLPLVDAQEVVRLAVRAPLTWFPPILDFFGGKLVLPEPFGLRHVWAGQPWRHRFMADDALRAATPVLRAVHAAAMRVLEENGADIDRFNNRSMIVSGLVQDAAPRKADVYDA